MSESLVQYEARIVSKKGGLHLQPTPQCETMERVIGDGPETASAMWLLPQISNLLGRLGYGPAEGRASRPRDHLEILRGETPLDLHPAEDGEASRTVCCIITWETSGDGGVVISDIRCSEGPC
jgi:hypothetical protein